MALKLVPSQRRRFCGQRINGQEMIIKKYSVPFPTSMALGAGQTKKIALSDVDVTWDPKKTMINQALLVAWFHSFRGWLSIKAMEVRLYVNGQPAIARGWNAFEGGCVTKGTDGTNIGGYLINGRNEFRLELVGSWELPTSGVDSISVTFEVWFTGKEPTVKPVEPEWSTYLKWGAIGVGILGAVYIGIRVYEASKKKA